MNFPYTLEDFREAYRETGLRPRRHVFFQLQLPRDGKEAVPCGCPITALIAHRHPAEFLKFQRTVKMYELAASFLGVERDALSQFIEGVDQGHRCVGPAPFAERELRQLGADVWDMVFAEFSRDKEEATIGAETTATKSVT